MDDQDALFMARALELAREAEDSGEVPVGAVLVQDGIVIGEGSNSPINSHDVTAHAEILALTSACHQKQNYRLPNSTLYVTLEPCAMCAGAIVHARVYRVVIATPEPRAGAAGSVFNILDNPSLNHRCTVETGLLQEESATMLKAFFKARRRAAKSSKAATKNA
ncbi:tRNA adenosine(34) deaminase TadA [Arenicella sp. 4NH20-0111]|uniref:tRNA adenosine(34) deaminase TadA n=1 Tax=Arenicella sp. 4NH20-0111 TaxID=3127648 RepID=UPI00310A384E